VGGGIATRNFNLDTRSRWVASSTLRSLYPQGKVPGIQWSRGPQRLWTRWRREKVSSLPLPGIEIRSSSP